MAYFDRENAGPVRIVLQRHGGDGGGHRRRCATAWRPTRTWRGWSAGRWCCAAAAPARRWTPRRTSRPACCGSSRKWSIATSHNDCDVVPQPARSTALRPYEVEAADDDGMRIRLDRTMCDGFGICAKHAPEYFSLDDWGYASLVGDGNDARAGPRRGDAGTAGLPRARHHRDGRAPAVRRRRPPPDARGIARARPEDRRQRSDIGFRPVTRPLPRRSTHRTSSSGPRAPTACCASRSARTASALIHPPQPVCRYCRSRNMGVRDVSGRGHAVGVHRQPPVRLSRSAAAVRGRPGRHRRGSAGSVDHQHRRLRTRRARARSDRRGASSSRSRTSGCRCSGRRPTSRSRRMPPDEIAPAGLRQARAADAHQGEVRGRGRRSPASARRRSAAG